MGYFNIDLDCRSKNKKDATLFQHMTTASVSFSSSVLFRHIETVFSFQLEYNSVFLQEAK